MKKLVANRQAGFTIIELMIATAVFSTILLMVTVMMINIGSLFSKGVNQARVQDAVRGIIEDVSQNLQATKGTLPPGTPHTFGTLPVQVYCLGNIGYSYVIGAKIGSSSAKHVLWRNTQATVGTCLPADLTKTDPDTGIYLGSNGLELITPNSRLRNFSVSAVSPYQITVGIAYGDDDLLCSLSVVGSCSTPNPMGALADYQHGDLKCKGQKGDEFCSVSNLTITVVQRLK